MATDAIVAPSLTQILKGSEYALTIFSQGEINALEQGLYWQNSKVYLTCAVTGRPRQAKPEEIVRQLYAIRLMVHYGYPKERLRLEKPVQFGAAVHQKAADIVVWERDTPQTSYIIVECKKPGRKDGLEQLKAYLNAEGAPIGLWTNGSTSIAVRRDDPNLFTNISDLPSATQTLAEILGQRWTIRDLERENKLVVERLSLKGVVLDMENLVLANAGLDAFDEVFKLIYAKLYDEWQASRGGNTARYLLFRVGDSTAQEFYAKVTRLFNHATRQWPGVFHEWETIGLEPEHLRVCGSVIDEAFEYLSVKAAKGEKGQYFTPRHVIDMAVQMLHPTIDEYVIDTAAGSCGFTVHAIFHVWGNEFSALGPKPWQAEYAASHVYGIDFDPRSVKIAKALNLIAGDGKSNTYRANTLDPRGWSEDIRVGLRPRLHRFREAERDTWNRENYRVFDFDILLTNPPFAGNIHESRLLHQYEVAKNVNGVWGRTAARDILFVERNLEFLRPGGRMAIVLPQGRFNGVSDARIRAFIQQHARIIAVVSLHINTFKPHNNTKTSVMFLQKWNDDPAAGPVCPQVEDYPIFFAISEHGGKDNEGDYIFRIGEDNAPLLDPHHHMIVEHDLDEVVTAFRAWAEPLRFSFLDGR
jgi:type I restriction enzyme M protein